MLDWVGGQGHAPAALTRETDPVLIVQEAGWDAGPVWTGAEKLAPIGIRSRSESLYWLRYPGPLWNYAPNQITEQLRRTYLEQQVNGRSALCLR